MEEKRREPLEEEPLFFDGQDDVIRDEPYEPTGEAAYKQKMKQRKKESKLKYPGEKAR